MAITRRLAALAVVAVLVGTCGRDEVAASFPDGTCVTFQGSPDGENAEISPADCSGPHTHIVRTWIADRDTACPSPTDEKMLTPRGTLCLLPDPIPGASP